MFLRFLISALLTVTVLSSAFAKNSEVTIEGVTYYKIDDKSAGCKANPKQKKNLTVLKIKSKVIIDGETLDVTEIADYGFKSCKKLSYVVIPASVRTVGELSFAYDRNLRNIIIRSNSTTFKNTILRFCGNVGPFFSSNKIETVAWETSEIPKCAYEAFNANRSPYIKNLEKKSFELALRDAGIDIDYLKSDAERPDIAQYMEENVLAVYENWLERKAYDDEDLYLIRTSEEKRNAYWQELYAKACNNYINQYTTPIVSGTLGEYDFTYKIFSILTTDGNQVYAKVPLAEKTEFENKFADVKIKPTYAIVDNELKVIDCLFEVEGKTYKSPALRYNNTVENNMIAANDSEIRVNGPVESVSAEPAGSKFTSVEIAPNSGYNNSNTFALIIGNENYKHVENVNYAIADANTFTRYCKNTLGLPEENIFSLSDATKSDLRRAMRNLKPYFENNSNRNLIVYYAGHGIPDKANTDSYLLPVDAAAGDDVESFYSLQEMYNKLGELSAKSVVVYLDACFTGAARSGKQLIASRAGVSLRSSQIEPRGNTVVFAATSADETAQPYEDAGHGIFTYFLLDKLQSTEGVITLGKLSEYISAKVRETSAVKGKKKQEPSVIVSTTFDGDWKSLPVNLMK